MTTFQSFKDSSAQEILGRIGFNLSQCVSWIDYREKFVDLNRELRNRDGNDCLVTRAMDLSCVLSTGEAIVLSAALAAADFDHLADELWSWQNVWLLDDQHRMSVAAVILRAD